MSQETEAVLDRRRLKRQVLRWRLLAITACILAAGAFIVVGRGGFGLERQHIARVSVDGMITDDRDRLRLLERLGRSERVAGVVLAINSPGGTTTGGEALFEGLRKLAAMKPVVSQFGTVAASAAYIAGLGTDHIVARGNTITGSVGVIVQWPEFSQLLDKIGVKINEVKSGPLKATPSPFSPVDDASRHLTEQMVADGQAWFIGLVENRRGVKTSEVPGLTDGRIYSGREALRHRLIDEIGGEAEAVRWLEEKRGVAKGLKVVDYRPRGSGFSLPSASSLVLGWLFGDWAARLDDGGALGVLGLDGLVSIWQPVKN